MVQAARHHHRGLMNCTHLDRKHGFDLVLRPDPGDNGHHKVRCGFRNRAVLLS